MFGMFRASYGVFSGMDAMNMGIMWGLGEVWIF